MLFLIIALIFILFVLIGLYAMMVYNQKKDYDMFHKRGETYEQFCNRYYTRWF